MHNLQLAIANKSYSSWSLRAWLTLTHFNIPFEEKLILLDQNETTQQIKKISPSGFVPALKINNQFTVWDSMAICEFLAETFPEKALWPKDAQKRAWARSICQEMHSGFHTLRENLPMKCHLVLKEFDYSSADQDIKRIVSLWQECLETHQQQGPYLFGAFSIADCMYAPVILRFRSYAIPLAGMTRQYYATMLENPALQQWLQDAAKEPWRLESHGD
ncbi:MAG TPA: glutathione S-transferase family protein [Gammaproteobacteria bacterium]|nr:glutathione S-transferase family protein [Gammaproteobacteria bacterium]